MMRTLIERLHAEMGGKTVGIAAVIINLHSILHANEQTFAQASCMLMCTNNTAPVYVSLEAA
ncbi:hypothetical protein DFQ01_10379 [Paenibacillus cellulosilyticus]|uniref:Uncharacterized protein n=1 Tax=Paenibacillus cellulosilyticus TaxID=375489 RepID=A0A2V2YWI3_9BACL|nr:hypothetical protein [Paenibacillus cellulosilyticus]PWW06178.1 hypothetical protein DFQ01_10379 [Paenibacillus cellulosilyticus]